MPVPKSDQDKVQHRDDANTINTEPLMGHFRCGLGLVQLALVCLHAESMRKSYPEALPAKEREKVCSKQVERKKIKGLQRRTLTKTRTFNIFKTFKIKYQEEQRVSLHLDQQGIFK